ncbi:MAG: HAD-IIIA family hydrolase [Anaerolineae bacterium]
MTGFQHIRAVAFDMGGTLMREDYAQTHSLRTMPFAETVLEALAPHAQLVVATNNNTSVEYTGALLERLRIRHFFSQIFTSKTAGAMKPHPDFFHHMLNELSLQSDEVVMIGDSYFADISGAKRCGLWTVWLTEDAPIAPDADAVISGLRGAPPAVAWLDEVATKAAEDRDRPALP